VQGKASKTKEISLDFLGFLWPILDFSMGYEESKEEKSSHAELAFQIVLHSRSRTSFLCLLPRLAVRAMFGQREDIIIDFDL
jgi:hypothetical protein